MLKYSTLLVREKLDTKYDVMKKEAAHSPEALANMLRSLDLDKSPNEQVWVILFNAKLQITGFEVIGMGGLTEAPFDVRAAFRTAILGNAGAVSFAHNHPSGDPTPSGEDIAITQRYQEAGKILGIKVLDHIILGEDSYVSLKEEGLM